MGKPVLLRVELNAKKKTHTYDATSASGSSLCASSRATIRSQTAASLMDRGRFVAGRRGDGAGRRGVSPMPLAGMTRRRATSSRKGIHRGGDAARLFRRGTRAGSTKNTRRPSRSRSRRIIWARRGQSRVHICTQESHWKTKKSRRAEARAETAPLPQSMSRVWRALSVSRTGRPFSWKNKRADTPDIWAKQGDDERSRGRSMAPTHEGPVRSQRRPWLKYLKPSWRACSRDRRVWRTLDEAFDFGRRDDDTGDDLREAVTMLEELERTARRVLGGAHPSRPLAVSPRNARRSPSQPPSSPSGDV